jgi:hypothetical protein
MARIDDFGPEQYWDYPPEKSFAADPIKWYRILPLE